MLNYSKFPNQGLVQGVQLYLVHGIEPGSFLTAVIKNDLKEACACADDENQRLLFGIVHWFYNEAPIGSWGSEENYTNWIKRTRVKLEGIKDA